MQAATGAGGNGLKVAEIENVEIATTGVDPMAAQYPGAHSTHTCGMYLAQWPQWSEFRNIDVRGLNTGVAIPALPVTAPAGLNADSNRWQNVTIQATHAFTAAAGSNNVLDNVVAMAGNSAATGEPPTGLVLDLSGQRTGMDGAERGGDAGVERGAAGADGDGGGRRSDGGDGGNGARAGVGSVWNERAGRVQRELHGAGDGGGECERIDCKRDRDAGRSGLLGNDDGERECGGNVGHRGAGEFDRRAGYDVLRRKSAEGQRRIHGVERGELRELRDAIGWRRRDAAGRRHLRGAGGKQPSWAARSQVDQFPGADIGAKIQACVNAVNASYGGTCDARNFTGSLSMGSNLTISTGNTAVLLPCATIATANQIVVTAGTRNVALRGCALRGGTAASGSQGGTVFAYSGAGAMVQVGDPTYATDTPGFHMDNVAINTTAAASGGAGIGCVPDAGTGLRKLVFSG